MIKTVIDSFKGEYHFLSNFYQCDFVYEGLTYHTAEAAFQAQKCSNEEDKIKYTEVKNPVAAKRMGKKEPNLPSNWNNMRDQIMYRILLAKFSNPELQAKLLATGYAELIEGNRHHDNYWGDCTCEKCKDKESLNRLGINLMLVRNHYRDEIEWKAACEEPWKDLVDDLRNGTEIDLDKLKHLIANTYNECENIDSEAIYFPRQCLHIFKYVSQASFFFSMNYLPNVPHAVSAALGDFISGLCYVIENGFNCGYYEHSLPLGLTRHTPAGCADPEADMSSYKSFLKAFNDNVEYLKTIGYDEDDE